jgi:hypothetical protein
MDSPYEVQPVERVYRGSGVVPIRGIGGMDAVVKPTWRYLRHPLTDTTQTCCNDERTTSYTPPYELCLEPKK